MYENQMKLMHQSATIPQDIDEYEIESKMIFLFSHATDDLKKKEYNVKKNTIAKKTLEMMNPLEEEAEYVCSEVGFVTLDSFSKQCELNKNILYFKEKFTNIEEVKKQIL